MKKILSILFLLLAAGVLYAQDFDPKDSWAYIYEDFNEGTVMTRKGETLLQSRMNVSVVNGRLHYIRDGKIMEADMLQVYTVKIKKDEYLNVSGKLLRILSQSEHAAVLQSTEVDMDQLSKAEIGYGISSATASTQGMSVAALQGIVTGTQSNLDYVVASQNKGSGERLPIRIVKYLFTKGVLVEARKREVVKLPSVDKKAAEAFFKENKIKWNKVEDLQKVADYIAQ